MPDCSVCGNPIPPERLMYCAEFNMPPPTLCANPCGTELPREGGVMSVEGKVGSGELIRIDPLDKHKARFIMTQHTRGPQHCTSG